MTYDWGHEVLTPTSHSIAWAFLYSDCEHEVLPVKSGHRITLAYDVFSLDEAPAPVVDSRNGPVSRGLQEMITDPTFFPEGITLGFGFTHSYPVDERWDAEGRALKGLDGVLYDTLTKLSKRYNLKLEWGFAYHTDEWEVDELRREEELEDAWGVTLSKFKHRFHFHCPVGDRQWLLSDAYLEEATVEYLIYEGARFRDDVIWLSTPSGYGAAGNYIAYGNEVGLV